MESICVCEWTQYGQKEESVWLNMVLLLCYILLSVITEIHLFVSFLIIFLKDNTSLVFILSMNIKQLSGYFSAIICSSTEIFLLTKLVPVVLIRVF